MKRLTSLMLCFASVAVADDFKTTDGKEYKNVTVSRTEPDGIVLITSSGISKVYFTELPKEVQERFHYDAAKAATYSGDQAATQKAFRKQQEELRQKRTEEREKYWRENPTPEPQRHSVGLTGSALDRPVYNQSAGSITPEFLVSEYAANEIKADNLYRGRIFTISGIIKSISAPRGETAVELVVPLTFVDSANATRLKGEVRYMRCIFNDSRGLQQKQAGNPISLTGRVAGVRDGRWLIMEDCHF